MNENDIQTLKDQGYTDEEIEQLQADYDEIIMNEFVIANPIYETSVSRLVEKTREEVVNNLLDSTLDNLQTYEHDLVFINHNSVCSELCRKSQNSVYNTEKKTAKYDYLNDHLCRYNGYKKGIALFHKNCRHWMTAYFEGESLPPQDNLTEADYDRLYKNNQNKAYIDKNKAIWYKRKERARITNNSDYEYSKDKWQEWNARSKNI